MHVLVAVNGPICPHPMVQSLCHGTRNCMAEGKHTLSGALSEASESPRGPYTLGLCWEGCHKVQHWQQWQARPCKQSIAGMTIKLEHFRHRMGQAAPVMGANMTLLCRPFCCSEHNACELQLNLKGLHLSVAGCPPMLATAQQALPAPQPRERWLLCIADSPLAGKPLGC